MTKPAPQATAALLEIDQLRVRFSVPGGAHLQAVNGLDLQLQPAEVLGLVGESGSGKSATALAIMDLLPGAEIEGRIRFAERPLRPLPPGAHHPRGRELAMVFQDASSSLNPVLTVERQVAEPLRVHQGATRRAAREETLRLLALAGLPDPERWLRAYPHQLSGGMRQRVMLAMALACKPRLLIADEPTTALDVTVQAGLLDRLAALRAELQLAILFITHDLSLLWDFADRIAVMYAGSLVELAPTQAFFERPCHPYSQALLTSLPHPFEAQLPPKPIPGAPPDPRALPQGCPFQPRCPLSRPACLRQRPQLEALGSETDCQLACPPAAESAR